jgi:TolA-binding protein
VALARAGRSAAARAAWGDFLVRYPRSPRRGEAQVALGWLEHDAGRLDAAAERFADAAGDPVPRIAAGARAGLEAIARRRAAQ